jgi:ATP-dependent DNA ligase
LVGTRSELQREMEGRAFIIRFLARVLPGAKPAPFADFIEPSLASLRDKVPSARGCVHELKLNGYRNMI